MNPITRILRVVARPVRRGSEHQGHIIQAYRGHGSSRRAVLIGRVFKQPGNRAVAPEGKLLRDLYSFCRRLLRRGLGRRTILLEFAGRTDYSETDSEGYFKFELDDLSSRHLESGWNRARLLLRENPQVRAESEIYITPTNADLAIISDIDDTVMETGVANKIKMFWRLFATGANSRVAFSGVAEFYRRLHSGPHGNQARPMLYVSRAPWSIYEMLDAFFNSHDIPIGPVLFLRDWGLTLKRPLPNRNVDHKRNVIDHMLQIHDRIPFVLIGDSGQHDPEIYTEVVKRHPGRVRAVYIRDVSANSRRSEEIQKLASTVLSAGSELILSDSTDEMIEHAIKLGLIS